MYDKKLQKAVALLQKGDFERAKVALEKLTKKFPEQFMAVYLLGISLLKLERYQVAITWLNRARKLEPKHAELLINLGAAYKSFGQLDMAKDVLQESLSITSSSGAHRNLGGVYYDLGENYLATLHYKSAMAAGDHSADICCQLAMVLEKRAQYTDAIYFIDKLADTDLRAAQIKASCLVGLNRAPEANELVNRLYDIAFNEHRWTPELNRLLEELGHFDKVKMLIENAKSNDPNLDLARLEYGLPTNENIEDIEQWSDSKLKTQPVKVQHAFSLAKHYKKQDKQKWISWLHKANQAKREFLIYDEKSIVSAFNNIKHTFDTVSLPDSGNNSHTPFFVLGMPRSGTTLIESILASHSMVFGAGELPTLRQVLSGESNNDEGDGHSRICRYLGEVDSWDSEKLNGISARYINQIRNFTMDAKHIVNKTPHNFLHVGMIHKLFPNAKIIHCKRNPIDTCLSIYEQNFSNTHLYGNELSWLADYYKEYLSLMEYWRQTLPEGVMYESSYEELVAEPETKVRELLEYCELEFEPNCLEFHKQERTVKTASIKQVRQGIYQSSIKRWQGIEDEIRPLLDAFGEE